MSKPDDRVKRDVDPAKESRESQERELTENRELTEDERFEFFLGSFHQSVLPDIPPIPGYHVCWLSTNNKNDTISQRMRLGYVPIRPDELGGWNIHDTSIQTGTPFGDVVTLNEMMAFKVPLSLYQRYMGHIHHTLPASGEEKLTEQVDGYRRGAQAKGADVAEFDGVEAMRRKAPPPRFL